MQFFATKTKPFKKKNEKLINDFKISQKSDITVYVCMTYNNNSTVKRLVLRP